VMLDGPSGAKQTREMRAEPFRAWSRWPWPLTAVARPGSNRFFFGQSPNGMERALHPGRYATVTTRMAGMMGSPPTHARSRTHHHRTPLWGGGSGLSKNDSSLGNVQLSRSLAASRLPSPAGFRAHPSSDNGRMAREISCARETRWLHETHLLYSVPQTIFVVGMLSRSISEGPLQLDTGKARSFSLNDYGAGAREGWCAWDVAVHRLFGLSRPGCRQVTRPKCCTVHATKSSKLRRRGVLGGWAQAANSPAVGGSRCKHVHGSTDGIEMCGWKSETSDIQARRFPRSRSAERRPRPSVIRVLREIRDGVGTAALVARRRPLGGRLVISRTSPAVTLANPYSPCCG
jgi:hypothetical protein